jgi:hypothetical protein
LTLLMRRQRSWQHFTIPMCTVTFYPRSRGYALAMNRDEARTRVAALPPRVFEDRGRRVAHPAEPGGGTWISLNDSGATLALVNWYSIQRRVADEPVSRGEVVRVLRLAETAAEADARLRELTLSRISPFRLVGVFPGGRSVMQWRWDCSTLERVRHPWRPAVWISSGFDEAKANTIRGNTFRAGLRQQSAGTTSWLRRLHRSHRPGCGPFSICMHREDAVTVSLTQVLVRGTSGSMSYSAGAPCERVARQSIHLQLTRFGSGEGRVVAAGKGARP